MNYGELKAAVKGYLHRGDVDAMLPVWLQLAEARIYGGEINTPPLRIAEMAHTTSMTSATRPADFVAARMIHEDGNPRNTLTLVPLELVESSSMAFAWDGEELKLSPDQSFPVTMHYWKRLPTLSADSDTNALLTRAPGIYLSAMLVEGGRWARDDELGAREAANYASAVNALHSAEASARFSGDVLTMRIPR